MHEKRIFTGIALIFALIAGVSAQVKGVPNEVSIDRLLRRENFTTLRFLVSDREDVKALFGETCVAGRCVFDDDWYIDFRFVGKILEIRANQPDLRKNQFLIVYSKPEFREKLLSIEFIPRKLNVLPDNYIFPDGFDCAENLGIEFNCLSDEGFVKYFYQKKADGTIYKKRIGRIKHRPSKTQYEKIVGESEVKTEDQMFPPPKPAL